MTMFWYGPHAGWGWALGLGSILFWLLVAAAIVALVLLLTRGSRRPDRPYSGYASRPGPYGQGGPWPGPAAGPGHAVSPEQILAERFARGEINQDEFHEMMAVLRAEAPHPGQTTMPG
jgi:putative membrane protein